MIVHEGNLSGAGIRLGIVAARFNETVVRTLVNGAVDVARRAGVADDAIELVWVPGAFEIPVVAATLASSGRVDAVLCLGAVIRGDTPHFEYVCDAATSGLSRVALDTGVPIGFGLLTCDDEAQALDRAGLEHSREDKGREAAEAALSLALTLKTVRRPGSGVTTGF